MKSASREAHSSEAHSSEAGMADKEHNLPVKVMDKKLVLPQKKPKKPDPPPRPVAEIYAERVHPNLFILGEVGPVEYSENSL